MQNVSNAPSSSVLSGNRPSKRFDSAAFISDFGKRLLSTKFRGAGAGEIVTTGTLNDPQEGTNLAEFTQTVRVWRGRRVIELEIELRSVKMPDGDPWGNYIASRFAWNDSAATLTRSVLGGAHGLQMDRFESPVSSASTRWLSAAVSRPAPCV